MSTNNPENIANKAAATYSASGVDIDAGNRLVERIKPFAKATRRVGSVDDLGGFGALFDLKAAGFKDPLLVSSTDGVGTKLKIAQMAGKHETIGIDLVAMCVNDLVVQGAEPLFFLDYFATGKLEVGVASSVISGIANGCKQAGCALVGGETAEMPGMYENGEYDLAGFTVGAVERNNILPRNIKDGDVIIGIASSGIHSNGFSLVRYILEKQGVKLTDKAPFAPDLSFAEILLTPTRIYVSSCLAALRRFPDDIKGFAHITGGGLTENLPRILPANLAANISASAWTMPAVFNWLQKEGKIPADEMWRTFNCGIGMVAVVAKQQAEAIAEYLREFKEEVFIIGEISPRSEKSVVINE